MPHAHLHASLSRTSTCNTRSPLTHIYMLPSHAHLHASLSRTSTCNTRSPFAYIAQICYVAEYLQQSLGPHFLQFWLQLSRQLPPLVLWQQRYNYVYIFTYIKIHSYMYIYIHIHIRMCYGSNGTYKGYMNMQVCVYVILYSCLDCQGPFSRSFCGCNGT